MCGATDDCDRRSSSVCPISINEARPLRSSHHLTSPHSAALLTMIDFIDSAFETLSPYVGLSKDQTKLVTILYVAVPLCAVLKRLPDDKPNLKNLFNIAYPPQT
jgi:hypothetical protein